MGGFYKCERSPVFHGILFPCLYGHKKFGPMRIACVGESTAEVFEKYNLDVELIAKFMKVWPNWGHG